MVIYCITLSTEPVLPPPNKPLVEELVPPILALAASKSPKSVPLPVDAMVIYSITFIKPPEVLPPPITPLVEDEKPDA